MAAHIQICECLIAYIPMQQITRQLPLSHSVIRQRHMRQTWCDHFILQKNPRQGMHGYLKLRRSHGRKGHWGAVRIYACTNTQIWFFYC